MAHSVEYALKKANNLLRKGNLNEAEKAFQSVLEVYPGNTRAQKGLRSCQNFLNPTQHNINKHKVQDINTNYSNGNHEAVVQLASHHLEENPSDTNMMLKLGASLGTMGNFEQAMIWFERVIQIHPEDPAPYNNIGTLHKMKENFVEAKKYYEKAIQLDQNHFDALKNIAFVYDIEGNIERAAFYLEKAVKIKPKNHDLHNHLGSYYSKLKEPKKAEACYKIALQIEPDYTPALNNLGNIRYAEQNYDEAISYYEKAISHNPNYGDALNNLGNVLKDLGYLDEAIENYQKAINIQPEKAELYSNHSVALKDKFLLDEALVSINKAIELKPDFSDAYWNKSLIQLTGKNFSEGWKNYEWRWKATNFDSTYLTSSKPRWEGKQERVLIWQEQGIGDQIMFSTMFEEFAQFCELPIFQVDDRLLPILRRTFPQFYFIPGSKKLAENEYDSHIPMGSMLQYVRTSEDDFTKANPTKLKADLNSAQKIRQAFRIGDRCLVGISWRSMNKATGFLRSLELSEFLTPFKDKNVELVNLQYGDCKSEIQEAYAKTGIAVKSVNEIDTFDNIDHLASLIECCDRVITIDNSTVHLSASMGKRTDVILPFTTDWRWCGGKTIPMWYDCLTVHRADYGIHLKDCINRIVSNCFKV